MLHIVASLFDFALPDDHVQMATELCALRSAYYRHVHRADEDCEHNAKRLYFHLLREREQRGAGAAVPHEAAVRYICAPLDDVLARLCPTPIAPVAESIFGYDAPA